MQKVYLISLASCSPSQLSFWYIVTVGGSDLSAVEESDVFIGEGGCHAPILFEIASSIFQKVAHAARELATGCSVTFFNSSCINGEPPSNRSVSAHLWLKIHLHTPGCSDFLHLMALLSLQLSVLISLRMMNDSN